MQNDKANHVEMLVHAIIDACEATDAFSVQALMSHVRTELLDKHENLSHAIMPRLMAKMSYPQLLDVMWKVTREGGKLSPWHQGGLLSAAYQLNAKVHLKDVPGCCTENFQDRSRGPSCSR